MHQFTLGSANSVLVMFETSRSAPLTSPLNQLASGSAKQATFQLLKISPQVLVHSGDLNTKHLNMVQYSNGRSMGYVLLSVAVS